MSIQFELLIMSPLSIAFASPILLCRLIDFYFSFSLCRNETRSLGNILEESHYQVPPTHAHNNKSSPASTSPPTSPLLQHHTPSTGTPTNATKKHHDYVNHMLNDGSRPSTPDWSPSLKQKRPQPLPRSLQRGESLTSETS